MSATTEKPFAVITGGSSGIGLALAREFLAHGYDIAIAAEDEAGLQRASQELRNGGDASRIQTVSANLATSQGVETLYREVSGKGRPIEALCVNAGIGLDGPFVETDLAREMEMIAVNVTGAVHLTKLVLRDMHARNAGKILLTSSIASTTPAPFEAVYGATKVFLRSFGGALHNELQDTGITVTVLMPGVTDTNFFHRAEMDDTKAGAGSKDDPAMVARTGFAALHEGRDKVVAGMKNKLMAAAGEWRSDQGGAAMHRGLSEPGSANR